VQIETGEINLDRVLAPPTESVVQSTRNVRVRIVASDDLTSLEVERMYAVFAKYYNNHSREIFVRDLLEKDHVIVLRDSKTKVIQGFSTLMKVDLAKYGLNAIGFYSGDTVLEREYWGSKALGAAFLTFLWREKIKNPFRPVYWFLISKGYKTYLLMANNFNTHYPRLDRETPNHIQRIMDSFYADRFGAQYNREMGLIEFDDASCCLKEKVAAISQELIKNEKIRFFAKKNPRWELGWELACLAEMTFWMPFKYLLKKKTRR
jgi:hypothetical protein